MQTSYGLSQNLLMDLRRNTMWEQFKALINGIEDAELKTKLLTGFEAVHTDNKNIIEARDKAKADNAPLKELVNSLGEVTGLGDKVSADALKELLSSKSKGGVEVDALTKQLDEIRGKYQELETNHNTFVSQANEKAFELAISQSEIFKDVSSDPFLRNAVLSTVKPKLILGEDGGIYARGDDGKVSTDILTGKPIAGAELFKSMIESGHISKSALNPTVGQGSGSNPQGTPPISGAVNIGTMSATEMMKKGRA